MSNLCNSSCCPLLFSFPPPTSKKWRNSTASEKNENDSRPSPTVLPTSLDNGLGLGRRRRLRGWDASMTRRLTRPPWMRPNSPLQQKPPKVGIMSDEEHHLESKADTGESKTYRQQAGTIRLKGYVVINNRPCKVIRIVKSMPTSKAPPNYRQVKYQFVGRDIFTAKEHEVIVPSTHICDVPHVNRTDYKLIGISEDGGFASLLNENGGTKDDVRLPTDDSLRTLIKDGFAVGKDLVLSVWSAMGEEQIYKVKKIDSKVCARKRFRRESLSATGEEQICAVMEIGLK